MTIFYRGIVVLAGMLFITGCGTTVRNTTAASAVRNASGIYPITMQVKKQSNAILDKSVRAEVVVWNQAAPMSVLPRAENDDWFRYTFDLNVPKDETEIYYYFRVKYQVQNLKNFDINNHENLSPPGAPAKTFIFRIEDRMVSGLDSERGRVGSTISILGKGFRKDDQVSIGGTIVPATFGSPSVLRFQIPPIAPGKSYPLEIVGTTGAPLKVGMLKVDESDLTVSPSPCTLVLGAKATIAIRLPEPAPVGGVTVAIKASEPSLALDIPAEVTVKAGKTEAIIKTTGAAGGKGTLTLESLGFKTATISIAVVGGK